MKGKLPCCRHRREYRPWTQSGPKGAVSPGRGSNTIGRSMRDGVMLIGVVGRLYLANILLI